VAESRPRILLVSLLGNTDNVSLKLLLAVLRRAGHDATILFHVSTDPADHQAVAEFIRNERFDIVGLSLMSPFFVKAVDLSRAIRAVNGNDVLVVWGGVHPTIAPHDCLPHADYVCVGEADHALLQFVSAWHDGSITQEIAGFNRGGVTASAPASDPKGAELTFCPAVEDLDALPTPEHFPSGAYVVHRGAVRPMDLSLFQRYGRYRSSYLSVMTTRGCPNQCTYCCNHLLSRVCGRTIRRRSAQGVLAEIRATLEHYRGRIHYIDLIDDCFTVHSAAWLDEFTEGCRPFGIPLVFRAIPQWINEEKARLLARAPAGFALVGIQSGSERTNREVYGRPYSRAKILECARVLDRHRIPAIYDVIVDNPYEQPEDWRETAALLRELPNTSHIFLYSLTFYPNTLLYDRARADGLDVEGHLTKSQDHYDEDSPEARWLLASIHFDPQRIRRLVEARDLLSRAWFSLIFAWIRLVLDPIRLARLAWLSQQGRLGRLLPLGADFFVQFVEKIYFPRRIRGGYVPASAADNDLSARRQPTV
jgi:anaerobic magnesium-protoporphyrin IX monomethyl ester cyclase